MINVNYQTKQMSKMGNFGSSYETLWQMGLQYDGHPTENDIIFLFCCVSVELGDTNAPLWLHRRQLLSLSERVPNTLDISPP